MFGKVCCCQKTYSVVAINGIDIIDMEKMSNMLKESFTSKGHVKVRIERLKFEQRRTQKRKMEDVNLNNSTETFVEEEQVDHEVVAPAAKKKRGKALSYVHYQKIKTWDELKKEGKKEGMKFNKTRQEISYFVCKTSGCTYKWRVTVAEDFEYNVAESDVAHTHGEVIRQNGLPPTIKAIINQRIMGNESTNAEAVLQACRNDGMRILPTSKQVQNHVSYAKKSSIPFGGDLSFDEIRKMVKELLGEDPDLMCFNYVINEENPSKTDFGMIFTCLSLMEKQRSQNHCMVDGTFKLIYNGFIVLLMGYSDVNRRVHITGVAIVSSESTNVFRWLFEYFKKNDKFTEEWHPVEVMADNSPAISAAIRLVFPLATRRNCFAHVIMACDRKFKALKFSIDEISQTKEKIRELSLHPFESHFDVAANALVQEWRTSGDEKLIQFADYFLAQYIILNKNWYAKNGGGCRTDNSIEVSNKWIKTVFITRQLPLMQAIQKIKLYLIKARDTNYGSDEFVITNAEWVSAYDFKQITKVRHDPERECYYVRRSGSLFTNDEFIDFIDSKDAQEWNEDDISNFQENICVVSASKIYENEYTCNCHVGALRKMCKHVIVIKVYLKKLQFPLIGPMRQCLTACGRNKPGRPRKHTPALSRK